MNRTFKAVVLGAFALVASQNAFANHPTCSTFSNGHHFTETSPNVEDARMRVLHECRTAWGTNDSECRMNLSCYGQGGNPYPGYPNQGLTSCYTSVDGYTFSAQSYNSQMARNDVVNQCWNHPYVYNKGRCSTNVQCTNYGPNPYPNPNPYPPYPNPNPYPPYPNPNPYPPYPNPNPYPPYPGGGSQGYYCGTCQVGAKCTNIPYGATQWNYVSSGNFYRILSCGGGHHGPHPGHPHHPHH